MGVFENYKRGYSLLQKGEHKVAAEYLERAKAVEPKKGSIREALARAYYMSGNFEKARTEFEAALEIDCTNAYAHFGLGLSLMKVGARDKALGHLKLAKAMSPDNDDYRIYTEAYLSYEQDE